MAIGGTCAECGEAPARLRSPYCETCADRVRQRRWRASQAEKRAQEPLTRCILVDDPCDELDELDPEIVKLFYDHARWRGVERNAASSRSARDVRRNRRPPNLNPFYDT